MSISKGSARWEGALKSGKGTMKPEHAGEAVFTMASRFEGSPSSNPEELIGAALSGCFSMAFAANLERAGTTPSTVETSAQVRLDKQANGFAITAIELTCHVSASGVDDQKFQDIAEETKAGCPVSKALAGTTITLRASLK